MTILQEMLPHKEYMEVGAAISTAIIGNEKECFIAGFKVATRLFMAEPLKPVLLTATLRKISIRGIESV